MSDPLLSHGLQHARLPCPSPSPGVCSNSCPESVMPSNHLILCRPLLYLPSVFSSIRVFTNELALRIRRPKHWSFRFISPSNEYSGLISFRIDWFDLLAEQETLKSLLQHHSSKASVLWDSAFFMVQLSHPSEKAMATHSSTLAWRIPWAEETGRLQSMGSLRVGYNWATSLSLFTFMHWRRQWRPTPVLLPGESRGRGSLVGYRLWGRTESDMTEAT